MRRRDFIQGIVGSIAAWPLAVRAQQVSVIGILDTGSSSAFPHRVAAFRKGLNETGFVEGKNVTLEFRWAEGRYEKLPSLAADLVNRNVAVIAATGAPNSAKVAQAATNTIPIVFATGGDPVQQGLVTSMGRPTKNVTGVTFYIGLLGPKLMSLFRELVPSATTIGVLFNPKNPVSAANAKDIVAAGPSVGLKVVTLSASTNDEIDSAFATIVQQRVGGLLVNADSYLSSRREQIVALAARNNVPTIYPQREYFQVGGLLSYGTDLSDGYRQAGVYCGRILKGAKPTDLPVLQPTKFELLVNRKVAKALRLEVPTSILLRADEVIE